MQHQCALLLGAFDRHQAHRWPRYRLADSSGVGGIVLAAFDVGLHVACGHKPHIVAKLLELASPLVRRGARLHADETRRMLKNSSTWLRLSCFLSTSFSAASTPCTWKTFLARSIPIVLICMWTALSCDSSLTITLWHINAQSGRRPPHQTRSFGDVSSMSALPPKAAVQRTPVDVSQVPRTAVSNCNKSSKRISCNRGVGP